MTKNDDVNVVTPSGDPDIFLKRAKNAALEVHNATAENIDDLTVNDLYIVWFAKGLQNWKALVATNVPGDGLYYEVTYNGDRQETYVDKYKKVLNFTIADIQSH